MIRYYGNAKDGEVESKIPVKYISYNGYSLNLFLLKCLRYALNTLKL